MEQRKAINSKLTKAVQKHPVLYADNNDDDSNENRTTAWNEVSREVSEVQAMSAVECKDRWTHLRIAYTKHVNGESSDSPAKEKAYYLAEDMKFLDRFIKKKRPSVIPVNVPQQERAATSRDGGNGESVTGRNSQSPGSHHLSQIPTSSLPCPPATPPANPQEREQSSEQNTLCNQLRDLSIRSDAEYLLAEGAQPATATQSNNTQSGGVTMFLSALQPYLALMNDTELDELKCKCFDAIAGILAKRH